MSNPTKIKSGFTALVGLPNAGKSSLLNRLIGERLAVVTPKAQTTWRCMRGHVVAPGLELIVVDTPGLQEGTRALNAAIARRAAAALGQAQDGAETVSLAFDAYEIAGRLKTQRHQGLEAISRVLERECGKLPLNLPAIPIINKGDLVRNPELRAAVDAEVVAFMKTVFANPLAPIWVSSTTGEGIETWLETLKNLLPEDEPGRLFEEDTLTDSTVRELAAEYVREQCFMQLGAELPYSVAVQIDSFNETDPKVTRIDVTLHVERDSQKPMVIGQGGEKIKSIGTRAREKIEVLLERKVYLGLKVKVTPHWARESKWVERFGYGN